MEKKFIAEIQDIMNDANSSELTMAAKILVKEAIRNSARNGLRAFSMPKATWYLGVSGVNVMFTQQTLEKIKAELEIEGFTIADMNNGYYTIQW